jgi:glycosidase
MNGAPVGKLANILRQDSLYPHPEFLVPFFGNHDTTRISGTPQGTPARLKLAFGLIFTVRGIPELYYGDEIGMPGGGDPDNRRDFPGGWTEDAQNAFSKIGRTPEQEDMHSYVSALLSVRAQHPALRRGKLWSLASDDTTYVFLRETDEERIAVAFHAGGKAREIMVPVQDSPAEHATNATAIFGTGHAELAGKAMKLSVPAQSVSVFLLQ